MFEKNYLDDDVLSQSKERISFVFDNFPRIYLSFSGGKDSAVMFHLVTEEALKRGKKIGILIVDLEAQYKDTIDFVSLMVEKYSEVIELYWVCLPIKLRNAVSQFEPAWLCWEKSKEDLWIRNLPKNSISDEEFFPFFRRGMEFEEFIADFGEWYSEGKLTACFVGIRADESLNRLRTIKNPKKSKFLDKAFTTWNGGYSYNVYPIYDWKTRDIWIYNGKFKKDYNAIYDKMHKAGLTINQARICQPYGDDQKRGLWLYHILEPETWSKIVNRVSGANQGALYINERGNVSGNGTVTKPEGLTWERYSKILIESMPPKTQEHFKNKISVFLKWYHDRGYPKGIPDEGPITGEKLPSWQRIAKTLLRNDYWCKGLSFTQTKTTAYEKYLKLMKKRRDAWGIF